METSFPGYVLTFCNIRHKYNSGTGPGLAIRVLGEATEPQLRIVRQADKIFIDELVANDLYRKTSQAFAALLPVRAVGVMGDKREHGQVISLRAVSAYFLKIFAILRLYSVEADHHIGGDN